MLKRVFLMSAALLAGACSKGPSEEKPKAPAPELAPPSMTGVPAAGTYRRYSDPDGRFSCDVPSAWTAGSDGGTQTPNASFTLRVPSVADQKVFSIFSLSIYYYAPGNGQFSSADNFIKRNAGALPGAVATAPVAVKLAGGQAKRWDVTLPGMGGPEIVEASKTEDTFVVLPQGKAFFVLNYNSLADAHPAHVAEFERLLESFRPVSKPGS